MLEFAFRIAAIYGLLGYVLFGLGLMGYCRPPAVLTAVLLAGIAFLWAIIRELRARRPRRSYYPYLILAALIVPLYSYALFIPPFARDDMIYHLQVPKLMAITGRLAFDPFNANSNFPLLFEMPFAALQVLKLPLSPFLINTAFALLFAMVFYAALGRRNLIVPDACLSVPQRLAAAAALAVTPVLFDLLHTAYAEIFFALLILMASLFYLVHLEADSRAHWLRACACLGLACAVKYPGVIFAALFIAHEFFRGRDRKLMYAGALLCAAIAGPWYLKSWILTGNPVFPLANSFFASPYISAMRFAGFHHMLADYNMGRAPLDYLLLPFRLALGMDASEPGKGLGFDGRLSLLFAVAIAGLGWKRADRRFVTLTVLAYFCVWAIESQQTRFLLAIVPIAAVLGLERAQALPKRGWWIGAGAVLILTQNAWNISGKLRQDKILPLLTGEIDANAFLSAQMPISYGLSDEINTRLDARRDKLMTVGTFGRNYYFAVPTLSNTFYEQEAFRNAFQRGRLQPDTLSVFFARNGVTHILFNWGYLRKMHEQDDGFDMQALEGYFTATCRTLYAGGGAVLYELKKPAAH